MASAQARSQPPGHDHAGHHHGPHSHHHAAGTPHPAQPVRGSLLRLPLLTRLALAIAASAGLWALVALALR